MNTWVILLLLLKLSYQQSIPSIAITPDNTNPPWKTSFTLECTVNNWSDNSIFFWRRDGTTFYPSTSSTITFSDNKQKLYFNSMVAKDSGSFSCAAIDTDPYLYEVSPQLLINVKEPPEIPEKLTVISATHDSLTIKWNHIGTVLPSYYIVRTNDIEVRTEVSTAVLEGLAPYTQYTLTVSSFNDVGTKGPGIPLLTRTQTAPPSGELEFIIGLRTSTSLQVVWSVPHPVIVNDELTGYVIQISSSFDTTVQEYTTNVTKAVLENLKPSTKYTITMHFTTICCTSRPSIKTVSTTTEGVTYEPTAHPVTGGAVKLKNSDIIGIVIGSIAFLILLIVLLAGAVYCKRRRKRNDGKSPANNWRDSNDDAVVSPPPIYSSPVAPLSFNYTPACDMINGSVVLNPSNSDHSYHSGGHPGDITPPPAYHSRSPSRSPSDNNSSRSTPREALRGTPRPLDSIRRDDSIKIVNRTPCHSGSSASPSSVSYIRQERALTPPLDNRAGDWI